MILEKMKALVRKKDICVLATVSDHKPYCSLMSYITDATCEEIYMVTLKNTTKFKNLQKFPYISLLIDSRETQPRSNAQAFLDLKMPMTFSILPKLQYSNPLAAEINGQGQEIMLHQPMEPYCHASTLDQGLYTFPIETQKLKKSSKKIFHKFPRQRV